MFHFTAHKTKHSKNTCLASIKNDDQEAAMFGAISGAYDTKVKFGRHNPSSLMIANIVSSL
jgi:hypothetical protein